MRISTAIAAATISAGLLVTSCGAGDDDGTDTSTSSTTPLADESAIPDTPLAPAGAAPSSCTNTPRGDFGLTRVEVSDTVVTWVTNRAVPPVGTVAFTVRDDAAMRGLKFLDGEVIANYTFDIRTGQQQNSFVSPTIDGTAYQVVMPLGYAISGDWTADLEVENSTGRMESTGTCSP